MARCLSECNVRLVYSLLGALGPGFGCSTWLVGRYIALQGVYLYLDVQQLIDLHEGREAGDGCRTVEKSPFEIAMSC